MTAMTCATDTPSADLTGLTVFVTGANRGLGAGFVSAALERGAARVFAGARDPASVQERVGVVPLRLDLNDRGSISAAAAATCGPVDLVVANAGAALPGPSIGPDAADVRRLFETNVFAQLDLVESFRPALAASKGSFVWVASVVALILSRSSPAYSASKAAGMLVMQGLRTQLADEGISVVVVFPGFVETDATVRMPVPKASPMEVAGRSLDAWSAGDPSIFPDRYAVMVREALGPGLARVMADPHAAATALVSKYRSDAKADP